MNLQKSEELKRKAEDTIARQFVPEENTLEFYFRQNPEYFKKHKNKNKEEIKAKLWRWKEQL